MLVLKGLVGLNRTFPLQLLQHYWLGHRLGLLWYWMVCLGNEQRLFCRFWDCIQVLHFGLSCWPWRLLHLFWGIPACSSRYNGHPELNSPIPVHFSSLTPRMSMFTLAISCLTTSNLPWFMDLTFHGPNIPFLCNIAIYNIGPCFYHQSYPQLGIFSALAPSLHSFWSYFSTDLQ